MGCGCGKSSPAVARPSTQRIANSQSTVPAQMQTGTFASRTVRSQDTPYKGLPGKSIRRSV